LDIQVTQTISITDQRISDLLCTAFEGGSNYWYVIEKFNKPEGAPELQPREGNDVVYKHLDYPLTEGYSLTIADKNDKTTTFKNATLNRESLAEGLQVMSDKYPKHFADFVAENDDADTGDVFLQCCCFGEVIFG
jgi:hypothetical protein